MRFSKRPTPTAYWLGRLAIRGSLGSTTPYWLVYLWLCSDQNTVARRDSVLTATGMDSPRPSRRAFGRRGRWLRSGPGASSAVRASQRGHPSPRSGQSAQPALPSTFRRHAPASKAILCPGLVALRTSILDGLYETGVLDAEALVHSMPSWGIPTRS